jgi:antitoxin VapB
MAFHVRDPETDVLVRRLAKRKGVGLTEAVRQAVTAELARVEDEVPLREKLRRLAEPLAAYPDTGVALDKQFFDELSGS